MSRPKDTTSNVTSITKPPELLPWEREALANLRKLTVGGRDMMIRTCHFMAIREAERVENASREAAKRPVFQLVKGGRA